MSNETETMREKYYRQRSIELKGADVSDLIKMAKEWGIDFRDNTSVEVLAGQIASAEWRNSATTSPRYPRPRRAAQYTDYPAADVTGVPFAEESPYAMDAQGEALVQTPDGKVRRQTGVKFDAEFSRIPFGDFTNMESGPMVDTGHNRIVLNVDPREMKTESADAIVNTVLPIVLRHFLAKNAEYGDRHRSSKYGPAGELIGIDRKMDKLRECLWEKKTLKFEQPEEMLTDIIGSALLALDLLQIEAFKRSVQEYSVADPEGA